MTFQDEDEVVISGIGGKFPDSENVAELAAKLFAGESLLTKEARKLTKGYFENLPDYNGKTLNNPLLFDNTFFGISPYVSACMDTLTCQILLRTFEAVIDAGINPSELRRTNTAVITGVSHSDSELEWTTESKYGYGIMGRNRCMNSNRISYWLDLNGLSLSIDNGWTNGISNLFLGWNAIKTGKCDTAIVGTASLQDNPLITMQLKDFGCLSQDGISRTFDDAGDGFGRSSAIVVLVLQRAKYARRNYATIGHVLSVYFGENEEIIEKPTQKNWEKLFEEFYDKANISKKDIQYIEAYGSSLREEDAEELNAITEFFCQDRKNPLLVGCVKSNIGHTESSSSLCGIVKMLIAFENGLIPQNLHYKDPNSLCPGLVKGQIKVVDKNTPISPDVWVAVNAHSFGGSYGHVILKANPKEKTLKYDNIPRLVLLSDRTDDYLIRLIEKVESLPFDVEFISLLNEIHSRKVEKYLGRGYTVLPKPENPIHEHQVYGEEKRPVWFIFSGMGSQWPKMGKRLMDLPIFRESIEKSHRLLKAKGLDLINIITTGDENIFDNILHSFVGIAAIQVALVDVLTALNVTADGFIGHSVGELGCAYADGCFTAEQMILAAYYRGRASTETELIRGSMAAVGKGYNHMKEILPEGVEIACHNSEDSCTLSGPVDLIHKFVAELKEQGIFAKSVNVSNIAYHSRYIKPAAPKLLAYLKEVVKNPKLRSSKWISTSNPESEWNTEVAKYCSAEYHTNNLLSSVLFEEGSKHIPKNAICIEIAPHGLLQAILKRSLGEEVTNIPLTARSADDPLIFLLQSIGKMYMAGIHPNVVNLYPKIEYPVSRGTQILHNLVHWHEHFVVRGVTRMENKITYSLKDRLVRNAEDGSGYIVNKENIYPLSIFLELVWDIFAASQKIATEDCPVVFENFKLERSFSVHLSGEDNVSIIFAKGTGRFEIIADCLLASGQISLLKQKPLEHDTLQLKKADLVGDEIYKDIKRKGYIVGDYFKNLSAVSVGENEIVAEIPVKANWIQTIESLIQLYILKTECPLGFFPFPCVFQRLEIPSVKHKLFTQSLNPNNNLTVTYDAITNTITCVGIKMRGLSSLDRPKAKESLKFSSAIFFPLMNPPVQDKMRFADFCFSVVLDDIRAIKNLTVVNILEVMEPNGAFSIGRYLQKLFCDFKVKIKTSTNSAVKMNDVMDFIITPEQFLDECTSHLIDGGFVLLKTTPSKSIPSGFSLIGKFQENSDEEFLLLKMTKTNFLEDANFIFMEENQAHLCNNFKNLRPSERITYIVCFKEPSMGIGNFKERIQAKAPVKLRWIFIWDPNAPQFSKKKPFYAEQLKLGLTTNLYKNGCWGGFCEYYVKEDSFEGKVNFSLEWSKGITPTYVSFDPSKDILKLQQVEYSGMHKNTKIMGVGKLLKNKMLVFDKDLTWEVPESWSLEDAATAPLSYALAYYCIRVLGNLRPYETVLVTDALTCLGQASIAVALETGSRVYVTVNKESEIVLIKKLFPKLKESDIVCYEDFAVDLPWQVKAKKNFADLVVNFLEGKKLFSVLNLIAQDGKIFHFGRQEAENNTQLGTAIFLLSLTFHSKTPECIMTLSDDEKKSVHTLVSNGIKSGIVKPLPRVVVSFNELSKMKGKSGNSKNRLKTLLAVNALKQNPSYVRFDINSSYIVIGDETDIWIDVAEWLINRNVQNIIVNCRDQTKRSELFIGRVKNNKNIFLFHHKDVPTLVKEAQKLGPISAVYYVSMTSSEVTESLLALDKTYRNPTAFLLAITKRQGNISELCAERNNSGFPTTNFIWDADEMLIKEHLEFMGKLCGGDPVINVAPVTTLSASDRSLADLLPSTIDDFCDIGSSLQENVRVTPLESLNNRVKSREVSPFIFISGLNKEPVKMLQPIAKNFMYPIFCVEIPNMKLSITQMASFILPEIIKISKDKVFNIVGISWGTHLAVELAKQLEAIGATVGVILIGGPFFNPKALITKSLESDVLNFIKICSKSGTNIQLENEIISETTWQRHLNRTLSTLNLPPEKDKDFCKAAIFLYNNLRALLNQDISSINIKGPLSIFESGEQSFDEKLIWKLSKSISIRCLPVKSEELLSSKSLWEIVHGSAVSQSMPKNTVHETTWQAFEEFAAAKEEMCHNTENVPKANMKFSFVY